jgi:hypothetical protein
VTTSGTMFVPTSRDEMVRENGLFASEHNFFVSSVHSLTTPLCSSSRMGTTAHTWTWKRPSVSSRRSSTASRQSKLWHVQMKEQSSERDVVFKAVDRKRKRCEATVLRAPASTRSRLAF